MSPRRIGPRRILPPTGSGTGDAEHDGRNGSDRCRRRALVGVHGKHLAQVPLVEDRPSGCGVTRLKHVTTWALPASMGSSALSLEPGIKAVADTANQGGGAAIRVPQRRRRLGLDTRHYRSLSRAQKQANHRPPPAARPGDAELKNWRILCKIHYRPGPGL
jgi:hypothetical protein